MNRRSQVDPAPRLLGHAPASGADAFVLLLHGGRVRSKARDSALVNSAIWRMLPFDRDVRIGLRKHPDVSVGVQTLEYRFRGWNEPRRDPVEDALWAVDSLRERHGEDFPIAILGHSMGGRVGAHLVEARPDNVRLAFFLAPWWPDLDGLRMLDSGASVRVMHGNLDPITNPRDSRRQTQLLAERGMDAQWMAVAAGGHYMLRRPSLWHEAASTWLVDEVVALALARRSGGA